MKFEMRCVHLQSDEISGQFPLSETGSALCTDLSIFALCIIGFSRFWLTMADTEIKVHRRVIRMIFPMIQRAKKDRSVLEALPVYDNGAVPDFFFFIVFRTNFGILFLLFSSAADGL